jgi:hypothetical protein
VESGYHAMKKGKKMPSIELDGRSDASFALVDGKIVRVPQQGPQRDVGGMPPAPSFSRLERE